MTAMTNTCADCGKPCSSVSLRCKPCYLARRRVPRPTCPDCGKTLTLGSTYCFEHAHRARRAPRSTRDGYVYLYLPGHPVANSKGEAFQHRLVLHDAGIAIPPGFQVHHINGIRDDNRLENLEVVAIDEHARRHARERGSITNGVGTFPVLTDPVERLERQRRIGREKAARRRQRAKEARAAVAS